MASLIRAVSWGAADACKEMARLESILGAPESGAGLVAIQKLVRAKKIGRDETVVLFSTGGGYKYMEACSQR